MAKGTSSTTTYYPIFLGPNTSGIAPIIKKN